MSFVFSCRGSVTFGYRLTLEAFSFDNTVNSGLIVKRSSPALPLKSNPSLCISFTSKTKVFAKLSISLRVGSSNVFLNASSPPKLPPPILETVSTSLVYWPNCKSTLLTSFSLKVANSLSKSSPETITPLEKVLVKLTSTDPFGASSTFIFANSDNSLKT